MRAKQGRAVFGVDMKIVDDDGHELPRDGSRTATCMVRGPWVIDRLLPKRRSLAAARRLVPDRRRRHDRRRRLHADHRPRKDVIKSGGEWISSIDLENVAIAHPAVAEAACIGVRASEVGRAAAAVRREASPGTPSTGATNARLLAGKVAKWWMPDDVVFVDDLPLSATGKLQKMELRREYADVLCAAQ